MRGLVFVYLCDGLSENHKYFSFQLLPHQNHKEVEWGNENRPDEKEDTVSDHLDVMIQSEQRRHEQNSEMKNRKSHSESRVRNEIEPTQIRKDKNKKNTCYFAQTPSMSRKLESNK